MATTFVAASVWGLVALYAIVCLFMDGSAWWGLSAAWAIFAFAYLWRRAQRERSVRLAAQYLYMLQEEFKLPVVKPGCEKRVRELHAELLIRDHPELLECNARSIAAQEDMERVLGRSGKRIKESWPELFEEEDD